MGRFNLVSRLAAVALATLLAVAVGATALSQTAPSFVDVTVRGAMEGDRSAIGGEDFGTANANGTAVTENVPQARADGLKDDDVTVNGDTVMGSWDGYTFTIAQEGEEAEASTDPSVKLALDDSDGTVGNAVTARHWFTVTTENIDALTSSTTVYVSGELDDATIRTVATRDGETVTYRAAVAVPQGTTPGEYTLSVSFMGRDGQTYRASTVLTVGDAGSNVSEAALVLSPLDADGEPVGAGSSQKTQAASAAADGDPIRLTLTSLNALGNTSNTPVDVTVTAAGAKIKYSHSVNAKGAYVEASGAQGQNSLHVTVSAPSVVFEISKGTPGDVEVSALIVDPNGSGYAASDKVELTFTGPAKNISVSDASDTLLNQYKDHKDSDDEDDKDTDGRDDITLKLTASDADDHAVVPTDKATVTIADPDGKMVATDGASKKIDVSQSVKATTNTIKLQVAAGVTAANPLDSGEYTVTVKDGTKKDTATFIVVGPTDSIALEADDMAPSTIGQTVTVTATLTDAGGNAVADGTEVTFTSTGSRAGVLVANRTGSTDAVKTKGGVAEATFVIATNGPGIVTATADGNSSTVVLASTAGATDETTEAVSLDCLSSNQGFATYTCGVDSSASELFGLVSGRGASAIHLWNGSAWVRYSVVDGSPVPGSSDFSVTEDDILYISN